ncbi:MAG TPA: GNAT family N-acetyltransferase [Isosphaeraceae bacterium]|jgi:hypothetical protein
MSADKAVFAVNVLFWVREKGLVERVRRDLTTFGKGATVPGHGEQFRFDVRLLDSEAHFEGELMLMQNRGGEANVILISDGLVARDAESRVERDPTTGRARPAAIVDKARRLCLLRPPLLGLIGLHEGAVGHVRDVDCTLSSDGLTPEKLREALLGVALGLRMKSRPPRRDAAATPAHESIRVEVAQSLPHVERGFRTRYAVYGRILRYLPDALMADPPGLDIDRFDSSSIHFVAVREKTNEVVGTMRLVLNYPAKGGTALSGSGAQPPFCSIVHSDWSVGIARRAGGPFRRMTSWTPPEFRPFPILMSTDFRKNQKQVIDETIAGCELSRLVVLPPYRGYGISWSLVKAAIAKAFQLKRKTILLECIPRHVEMYSKYGFRQIADAPHSRPADLDQYAIAMRLTLTQQDVAKRAEMYLGEILGRSRPAEAFPFIHFGPFDVPADVAFSEPVR